MAHEITFYHNPMSRGRIVHWMLEEIGIPYETKIVSLEKREHKSPEYLAINPMGKIPTIVHNGTIVTEAAAICAYLADAFPNTGLAPALNEAARGTYYRWMFFAAGCVEPALIDKMFARPPVERPTALGYGNYQDTLNAIEKAISPGPWVLGERFSAADVYLGSLIGWGMFTKALEPRTAFQTYFERCSQRPAWKRANSQ
jgi:glutathione S-transferase